MQRNKNILVISHMYPRKNRDNYGTFVYEQVKALVETGNNVTVISPAQYVPGFLAARSSKWQQYNETEEKRTDFDKVSVFFSRYFSFPRKLFRSIAVSSCYGKIRENKTIEELIKQADVIIAHTALFDGRLAKKIARIYNKEYFVYIHGEDLFQNTYGIRNIVKKINIGSILKSSKGVITVSNYMKKSLEAAYDLSDKIKVIHNGVDLSIFRPNGNKELGGLSIISASFLIPRKGQQYLIKALSKISDEYTCEIAGPGPEKENLEKLAANLGIDKKIRFTGSYINHDFPKILERHNLFVLPSWDEAFGVVYIEALAMGLPVIAANDAGAPDIVTEGVDGYLVKPKDEIGILKAIKRYLALSENERAKMSQAAINKSKEFTWCKNAERLLEVIDV